MIINNLNDRLYDISKMQSFDILNIKWLTELQASEGNQSCRLDSLPVGSCLQKHCLAWSAPAGQTVVWREIWMGCMKKTQAEIRK